MMTDDRYIGKTFGGYRIIELLSSAGGFGRVYLARHTVFQKRPTAVIKQLHTHLASDEEKERFLQEAHFLEKLKHPHILPIIDAGIQDGLPYLITEYAPGGSLKDRLRNLSANLLPWEEAMTVILQIGKALYYAHQQNVVHRDLKPDNILFNAQGEALLADFGIAMALERTKLTDIIGSPPYMAPEQFTGTVSKKSDQYALGCIAYELITGHRPFDLPPDANWFAWAHKHRYINPVAPTQINSHLSEQVERTVLMAMEKQYLHRHRDVLTFITLLKTKEEWIHRGHAFYEMKRYEDAIEALDCAIWLDPSFTMAHICKGNILYEIDQYDKALDTFELAIQLAPNNSATWRSKGDVLKLLKREEEAEQAYERASQLKVAEQLDEGCRLLEVGDYSQAALLLRKIPRPLIQSNVATNHICRSLGEKLQDFAEQFFENGRLTEATDAFELAMEIDHTHADVYPAQLGNCYLRHKNYKDANQSYVWALKLNPLNWVALLGQSEIEFRRNNNLVEALKLIDFALQHSPSEYQLWNQKALLLLEVKECQRALAAIEKALDLSHGEDSIIQRNKTVILERLTREPVDVSEDTLDGDTRFVLGLMREYLKREECAEITIQPCTFASKEGITVLFKDEERKIFINIGRPDFVILAECTNKSVLSLVLDRFMKDYLQDTLARFRKRTFGSRGKGL